MTRRASIGIKVTLLLAVGGWMLVATALAPSAGAQSPEDIANDVASEIMSPYCPGVTLHDCPSSEAIDLREQIVDYAESGMSKADIIATLEERFGPSIRATPSSEGAGIVTWILPSLALLAGGALLYAAARRWIGGHARPAPASAPGVAMTKDERTRLDAELRSIRGRQA